MAWKPGPGINPPTSRGKAPVEPWEKERHESEKRNEKNRRDLDRHIDNFKKSSGW